MGTSDYDGTPANNTAINGINIQGSSAVLNFDNAFRQIMADIANEDRWATAETDRYRRMPDRDLITATDVAWAYSEDCVLADVFILGGGGGSGYCTATGNTTAGATAGGNGGGWVRARIDVAALRVTQAISQPTTSITIGAGGSGGVGGTSTAATDGGDTIYADGTTTLTADGGVASGSLNSLSQAFLSHIPTAQTTTSGGYIRKNGELGSPGIATGDRVDNSVSFQTAMSGKGGDSPYGTGGHPQKISGSSGATAAGAVGAGYGAGASGSANIHNTGGSADGAAGTSGLCIIVEYSL